MEKYTHIVQNELGMHARPAGQFVKLAGRRNSVIEIHKGEKAVNVNRILAVMGLGIRQGDQIDFTVCGEDEAEAVMELKQICEENL